MYRFILFTTLLTIVLVSCTKLRKSMVQEPQVKLQDVRLNATSFSHLNLNFLFQVKNPNSFGIHVGKLRYNLKVEGHSFLKGENNRRIDIAASGTSSVAIPIDIALPEVYQMWDSLKGKDSVHYQLQTTFYVNLPVMGQIKVPFRQEGAFLLLQPPHVQFRGIRIVRWNFSGADVQLLLELHNPNPFAFAIQHLRYGFQLNNLTPVSGELRDTLSVSRHHRQQVALPLHLDFRELGSAVLSFLRGHQSMEYRLTGEADISSEVPYLHQVHLPFRLSGNTGELLIER